MKKIKEKKKSKSILLFKFYKLYLSRKQIYFAEKHGHKKEKEHVGQDTIDVIASELGPSVKYFAVYDGHGVKGGEASQFAKEEVKQSLINDKKTLGKFKERKQVEKYFKNLFNTIQGRFKKRASEYESSGTCAICVLLVEHHCFVINLGDSRAVIGTKQGTHQKVAFQMSIDHKPNREEERKRIESSGGMVTQDRSGA